MSGSNQNNLKQPRPTVKTIARMTGYSVATVSKALRNSPVVAAATREAIATVANSAGYRANPRAVALRTGRTMQIGVLMPVATAESYEWSGVEFTQILSGISQAVEAEGYRLSVLPVRGYEDGERMARQIVASGGADGLIFSGILADDPRVAYLRKTDFPFVTLGRCHGPHDYAFVESDSRWVAYDATKRLIGNGHLRIALINPPEALAWARDRIAGYRDALVEAGLAFDRTLIIEGDLSTLHGQNAAMGLSHTQVPPTGFICANEATTLGVLSALACNPRMSGRAVEVISYDDLNISAYFSPAPSTYFLPIERLGRTLGEFLLRRIAGEPAKSLQKFYRPEFIARRPNLKTESKNELNRRFQ